MMFEVAVILAVKYNATEVYGKHGNEVPHIWELG
jgi:hypothetical protein